MRQRWLIQKLVESGCDGFSRGIDCCNHFDSYRCLSLRGITASGSSFITAYLLQTGQGVLQAVFSTSFLVEPVDKITTCMLAFAIVQGLSKRFVARFPRPENVEAEGGASQTQLYIAVGVVVLLVLFAAFMLRNVLGG